MLNSKRIFFGVIAAVIVIFIIFSVVFVSFAQDDGMQMPEYHVNVNLLENNVAQINETIKVNYLDERHGMFRKLPLKNYVVQKDDGKMMENTYMAVVDNINVLMDGKATPYEQNRDSDMLEIKIGDADAYITGEHTYDIGYDYDFGADKIDSFDNFYLSFTGTKLEAPIQHLTFEVTMPKEFDVNALGFNLGPKGVNGYDPNFLKFTVQGNTITGEVLRPILPGESLDIYMKLPQGYFVGARSTTPNEFVIIIPSIVLVAVSILILLFVKKRRKRLQTVEFSPPENVNSADAGFIYDLSADSKDIVSLIIYWANKGYLTINQLDKHNMEFTKLKDLDENVSDYEKLFFSKLFEAGDVVSTETLKYSLGDGIAVCVNRLKSKFTSGENNIINRKSGGLSILCAALAPLPVSIAIFVFLYFETYNIFEAFMGAIFAYGVGVLITSVFVSYFRSVKTAKTSKKVAQGIFMYIVMAIYLVVLFLIINNNLSFVASLVIVLCTVAMMFIAPNIFTRNDKGEELYAKLEGLKHFIITVEEDKLKLMAEENPEYFYNILPYAFVLGVTDKWSKKFEKIANYPPNWYTGYNGSFSTSLFTYIMVSNMMTTSRYSSASSSAGGFGGTGSGGSGFGGGGFSGGGFGGGGGSGSW